MFRLRLVIAFVLLGCGAPASHPTYSDASTTLDSGSEIDGSDAFSVALDSIRSRHEVPALAALELRAGHVHRASAVGVRRLDDTRLVTTDDRWHLGSCGKAMSAALFALLADGGGIGFDTTLEAAFPELEIHEEMRSVTLYQLLVHRGGLPEDRVPTSEIIELLSIPGAPRDARAELARRILSRPPEVAPNTEMRYSNFGYVIVGAALERVSNATFEDLMRTRLFMPLEMNSCGFGPPAAVDEQAVAGHISSGAELVPVPAFDNPAFLAPAGTMHCSLSDWARFVDWTMTNASDALSLSEAAYARLRMPTSDGYAPGFFVTSREWARGPLLTHAGSNGSFLAVVWAIPEERRALFAVTNTGAPVAVAATDEAIRLMLEFDEP